MRRCDPFVFGGATVQVLAPGPAYAAESLAKNEERLARAVGEVRRNGVPADRRHGEEDRSGAGCRRPAAARGRSEGRPSRQPDFERRASARCGASRVRHYFGRFR